METAIFLLAGVTPLITRLSKEIMALNKEILVKVICNNTEGIINMTIRLKIKATNRTKINFKIKTISEIQ